MSLAKLDISIRCASEVTPATVYNLYVLRGAHLLILCIHTARYTYPFNSNLNTSTTNIWGRPLRTSARVGRRGVWQSVAGHAVGIEIVRSEEGGVVENSTETVDVLCGRPLYSNTSA